MLWIATLLALALAVVGYGCWWLLRARRMPLGNWVGVVALALWVTAVSIVWLVEEKGSNDAAGHTPLPASLAWPATTEPPPASATASGTGVQAASVESLVTGLEARLAEQPNDAAGWALLAQSYAYMANDEGVERAVRRAVDLGADERMLRERVAQAKSSAHGVDLVEKALRTGVYR